MEFEYITSDEKVESYLASNEVFEGLIKEMRELSKKKADATLSGGKVKMLNRVLADLKEFLCDEPEAKYLDALDDEDLPQNSDAVLVMVQYESASASFRRRYHMDYLNGMGADVWITDTSVKTYKARYEEE